MQDKQNMEHGASISRRHAIGLMAGAAGVLATGPAVVRAAATARGQAVDWSPLQSHVQGRVVSRQEAEYEHQRQSGVWNARRPPRFPEAIVRATSEQDVQEAVRFARKHHLKVAVRGGGHSFCVSSLREGGLLIDLSQLNGVRIDPDQRQAVVQPVVTDGDFAARLASHGLAFPVGHCASVPLSGYLLNGGIGWNSNVWGPACLSVQGVDLVNAEGELIHADAEQNPDYYWAARGAGPGFFGVVTRYYLQLYSLPAVIRTSTVAYRLEDAERVAEWLPDLLQSLPPQVELNCFIVSAQPPQRLLVVAAAVFADTPADAERWLQPVADGPQLPQRHDELNQDVPFASLFELTARVFLENRRYATEAFTTDAPPREILTRVSGQFMAAPSVESFALLALPAPRPADTPPPPDMAFSLPGSAFVGLYGIWPEATQDAANEQWVRETVRRIEPIKVGHYIGETDLTANADRPGKSFAPANWQRLQQLRGRYDPYGVFFDYLRPSA